MTDTLILFVIAGGEIAFWVVLVLGLAIRYPLGANKTSTVLLACVPLIDLIVLTASVLDLLRGATPSLTHGLAAVYLGFSLVFGPSMVRWADVRFAHRFAGGPAPVKRQGRDKVRHEWREWGKCVLACAIAAVLILGAIALVVRPGQGGPLLDWMPRLGGLTGAWLLFGPIWVSASSSKRPDTGRAQRSR